jgi:ribosomal protein S18 acetylase RimI-like enzyme
MPEHRGQGVGRLLLNHLIARASTQYAALSLSVDPQNPAMRLYQTVGFAVVGSSGTSLTMRKGLENHRGNDNGI